MSGTEKKEKGEKNVYFIIRTGFVRIFINQLEQVIGFDATYVVMYKSQWKSMDTVVGCFFVGKMEFNEWLMRWSDDELIEDATKLLFTK